MALAKKAILSAAAFDETLSNYPARFGTASISPELNDAIFAEDGGTGSTVWFTDDAEGTSPIAAKRRHWDGINKRMAFDVAIPSASPSSGATIYVRVGGNKPADYPVDPYDVDVKASWPLASDFNDRADLNHAIARNELTAGGMVGPDGVIPATVFNGTDHYAERNNLWDASGPVTFQFWTYTHTVGRNGVGGKGTNSSDDRLSISAPWEDGNLVFDYGNFGPGRVAAPYGNRLNDWHLITGMSEGFGGSRMELLIDGVSVATTASADGPSGTPDFDIGRSQISSNIYHDGGIAEVILTKTQRPVAWARADFLLQGPNAADYWTVTEIGGSEQPQAPDSVRLPVGGNALDAAWPMGLINGRS